MTLLERDFLKERGTEDTEKMVHSASFVPLCFKKTGKCLLIYLFFSFILSCSFCVLADESTTDSLKRISAHLMVNDPESACDEAIRAINKNPDSQELYEAYIKALSKARKENELIDQCQKYLVRFKESKKIHDMLEYVSWGIIEHASTSNSPIIRIYALLGAFFAQDARGVAIIHNSLSDQNSLLRGASLQLASNLRDAKLQIKALSLLQKETNFMVRQEAIKAACLMKNGDAKQTLEKIIADDHKEHEEKALAIQSLVHLMECAKRSELEILSKSCLEGLRELSCQLILDKELKADIDLIVPFLKDSRREVRKGCLEAIGGLRIETFCGKNICEWIGPLLQDIDPKVAITAAWVLTLNDQECGKKALNEFIFHPEKEIRLFTAAALVKSGKYGVSSLKEAFQKTEDPFVKMNLSLGLIGQREWIESATSALYEALNRQKEPLVFVESGLFRYLAPSHVQPCDWIPNEREAMNQLCRLEIFNILSMMNFDKAEDAIKQFLKENTWGISAMASLVLLSEGTETSIELVKHLLNDSNEKIRIQAALILSLWDSGSEGLTVLQEAYATSNREMKERILEGIGRIGSPSSIPFLVKCLKEPFQSLRVIAASSLLQVLYH